MSFWSVVLLALIGVPFALFVTGMGMIFAAAGYANGGNKAHANAVVVGWLVIAWGLVSALGAFGLAPAWRAWHGGAENFDGALQAFIDWLAGVGIAGALAIVAYRAFATMDRERAAHSPLLNALRWLLLVLGLVPYAAIAAWLVWPLVLWPVQGRFAWPDPAAGWMHTAEIAAVLVAAMGVETVVRKWRKR